MRVAIHLANDVRSFQPTHAQLLALESRVHQHSFLRVESKEELLAELPNLDAVVVWRFDRDSYARSSRLRHVFTPSAGRESIAPDPGGRVVVHYGTFHGRIMAESLLAMVLFMNRRLGRAVRSHDAGSWDRTFYESTRPLSTQSALIVGYGHIGRHMATLLRKVGMSVCGMKRDLSHGTEGLDETFDSRNIIDAVGRADHVVCVLPGDTGTDSIIDRAALEGMRRTTCVYNLGRGNAIDAEALVWALESGRIAGAFLDVTPQEPLPHDSRLWRTPNLYITPHASAIRNDYLDLYFAEITAALQGLG